MDLRLRAGYYRGRFVVDDPAKAPGLTLTLVFTGGARAFVNGTELDRAHLPAGELTFEARGEDYPLKAYPPGGEPLRERNSCAPGSTSSPSKCAPATCTRSSRRFPASPTGEPRGRGPTAGSST